MDETSQPQKRDRRTDDEAAYLTACAYLLGVTHTESHLRELAPHVTSFLQRVSTLWTVDVAGFEMAMVRDEDARGRT